MTFRPTIARDSQLFELPRPITVLRVLDRWDFDRAKVPRVDGDTTFGHSRDATEIIIEGQIGSHAGQLRLTETEMFQTLEDLRAALHGNEPDETFEFYLFDDINHHRSFRRCSTLRFEFDLSEKQLYTYGIVIRAADPLTYSSPLS